MFRVEPATAERLLELHWKDEQSFRDKALSGFVGNLADVLENRHATHWQTDRRAANLELLSFAENHHATCDLPLGANEDEIRFYSTEKAAYCRALASLEGKRMTAERAGIEPPDETLDPVAQINRLNSPIWWRRKIRVKCTQAAEAANIDAGLVSKKKDKYVSRQVAEQILDRRRANRTLLEALTATNENGYSLTLADAADRSISNPAIRRCELMTRLRGFEDYAKAHGHAAEFYTITCPSKMHRYKYDGTLNPRYDGSKPNDAQKYLCRVWARIRASLARDGVDLYGFRIAEPHHDGCPHWHLLLFTRPGHRFMLCQTIRKYSLESEGQEPGASEYRVKLKSIDPSKGSAVGYVAKYISKNIDGYGLNPGEDYSARLVNLWAACWRVRQFQAIGEPSITVWRELRKLEPLGHSDIINALHMHADAGDYGGYLKAQGGPFMPREYRPGKPYREFNDDPGMYGDPVGMEVVGIEDINGDIEISKIHEWKITAPWTRVNNCTAEIPPENPAIAALRQAFDNAPPIIPELWRLYEARP